MKDVEFDLNLWDTLYKFNLVEVEGYRTILSTRDQYTIYNSNFPITPLSALPKISLFVNEFMEEGNFNWEKLEFTIRTCTRLLINYTETNSIDKLEITFNLSKLDKLTAKEKKFVKWFCEFFTIMELHDIADERGGENIKHYKPLISEFVHEKFDINNFKVYCEIAVKFTK